MGVAFSAAALAADFCSDAVRAVDHGPGGLARALRDGLQGRRLVEMFASDFWARRRQQATASVLPTAHAWAFDVRRLRGPCLRLGVPCRRRGTVRR